MIKAIILYGSKARNDGESNSDTDLLGVFETGHIRKPYNDRSVSFHLYPLPWLLDQASQGNLFLLHIVNEGVAIFDPNGILSEIKNHFTSKASYISDVEVGVRIIAAITILDEDEFSPKIRTRFFWGLRTALIAAAANQGRPIFSASNLEQFAQIEGLACHIKERSVATFDDCQRFARRVIVRLKDLLEGIDLEDENANLQALFNLGGVGAATAGEIVYGFE